MAEPRAKRSAPFWLYASSLAVFLGYPGWCAGHHEPVNWIIEAIASIVWLWCYTVTD